MASAPNVPKLEPDTVYLTTTTGRPAGAHVPNEAYNLDTERARAQRSGGLAALGPKIVGVGHLGPMTGPDIVRELERAAG